MLISFAHRPLPATIETFWKMVWEHKVTCIIMATGLVEGSKVKCERYWPQEFKEDTYGDVKVEWMAAEKQTGYLVTRLKATKVRHLCCVRWLGVGGKGNERG